MKAQYKEMIDIRTLEFGSVYPMLCTQCGTAHNFISSYNEKTARTNYRAFRDCPVCTKKEKGETMRPSGVTAKPLNHSEVEISYHYIGTHEEACELFGVHEALHEEYPMLEKCIKCQDDENAQAANS